MGGRGYDGIIGIAAMTGKPDKSITQTADSIGTVKSTIPVEISTRFLEHFSEQLYSSPQKAFEELISNGWDAGADYVDIRLSSNLGAGNATLCVLDNGESMDEAGLRRLWHIAYSKKKSEPTKHGRQQVGKFGIGKLATYVLARKLTYLCKAADGIIRRVTMDYSTIDTGDTKLVSEMNLDVYEVKPEELQNALQGLDGGNELLKLIEAGIPHPKPADWEDEFGAEKADFKRPRKDTWTLAVLSNLKDPARDMKVGVLRRMLQSALPLGQEMVIAINGDILQGTKEETDRVAEWVIGPELDIKSVSVDLDTGDLVDDDATSGPSTKAKSEKIDITADAFPVPHVNIPGIGRVTGRVRVFRDKISGGKSEDRGASNGFHVNVLGRIVNQNDPSFGEENLSHAVWARFRMAVRADGLNPYLTTNREQFRNTRELKIFRAFLRKVFNKARGVFDSDDNAKMPDGGDVLVKSLGVLSLNPLRNVVAETLKSKAPVPALFDETGMSDKPAEREEKLKSWQSKTADHIQNALGEIKYASLPDESFVKFRLHDSAIVVNNQHPFVTEHSGSRAEKQLLRTIAMINLLTDVYAIDAGVKPTVLEDIIRYRDRLLRFKALQTRKSGLYIAQLLLKHQHESDESKRLEAVLSDALRYLGFSVKDLAQSGEPEGVASAYPYPSPMAPTDADAMPPLYKFTFDAKSSNKPAAKTSNLCLDAIKEHQNRYKADFALVVAPGFTGDAVNTRCEELGITPMAGKDLGRLLEFTVEYGAIPLTEFRGLFKLYDHTKVSVWVSEICEKVRKQRTLTIDVFLKALEHLKGKIPDVLSPSLVAYTCRENLKVPTVRDKDVIALVTGLAILVPDLVGLDADRIVINASADKVARAVQQQLDKLHEEDSNTSTSAGA